ncbi:MAG TPA: hypothetical protein VMD99_17700 [Terriglobales bacterium]|nr:hypothetical protein [Terriglobales bacterium]
MNIPSNASLTRVARFPNLRALAWSGDLLYASRGYELLSARIHEPSDNLAWQPVAAFRPPWRRQLSASNRLTARLFRDGFHALAVLPSGGLVAAVAGAILFLHPNFLQPNGDNEFRVTHRITRGTRPLHLTATPGGSVYWGEYFDNSARDQVHIYASTDGGATWAVAYTFPQRAIRHVHNIVHDPWANCLWILTGDYGGECRILRANYDFSTVEPILQGNQQARAVAFVPTPDALYFSSDTPLEQNYIYRLDRQGKLSQLAPITSSSIYGCRVADRVFFSTMVEPSKFNPDRQVRIYANDQIPAVWQPLLAWEKDLWPPRLFQYGNAYLPDGNNTTPYLAVTTAAVTPDDATTSLYSIST